MAPKKRRGGLQQRIAEAAEEEARATGESSTAKLLLKKWVWGEISPQQVQAIASAGHTDVQRVFGEDNFPDLRFLAIGTSGRYPQCCSSELLARVEPAVKLQKPFLHKIHFKEPVGDREQDQAFFLPHETFAAMHAQYPESFITDLVPRATAQITKAWPSP